MTIKLVCFEPWRGTGITRYDSGFGDRMRFWELAYYLSTIIDNIEIIVEEEYWPELLLLDLPNTTPQNISSLGLSKNQLIPISYQEVKNIVITKNSNLSIGNYYYFNFLMSDIYNNIFDGTTVPYDLVIRNAVSKIKLNLSDASDYMQQQFSDYCCIHLRRGNGTFPTAKFLREIKQFLTSEIVHSYWKEFHRPRVGDSIKSKEYKYFDFMVQRDIDTKEKDLLYLQNLLGKSSETVFRDFNWVNEYKIIPDSDYFNLISNFILKENSHQKIYISSDIPKQYFSYYYENFPYNIIDTTLQFQIFLKFYEGKLDPKKLGKEYSIPIDKVFENVFDLMVGFHSKIIVKSTSNWSEICSLYEKKKVIHASRIESINSFGNWIFMDEYPYLPLSSVVEPETTSLCYRPTVSAEVDFKDKIIYNQFKPKTQPIVEKK